MDKALVNDAMSMLDLDPTILVISVLFSIIGYAYYRYGKKQAKMSAIIAGVALCVFPYFVTNLYGLLGVGAGLMAVPFLLAF